MKIAVIGSWIIDDITTHRGEKREGFGGVIHNIIALLSLFENDVSIHPFTVAGNDYYEQIKELLTQYENVDPGGLILRPGVTAHSTLVYTSINWREERGLDLMKPFSFKQLEPCLDSDVILMNFVSGTECDRETFKALCEKTQALVHVDIHSKIATFDKEGNKTLVVFSDWKDWLKNIHSVQMNEFECELVVNRKLKTQMDYVKAGYEILQGGPSIVLITLGPQGSIIVYRKDNKAYYCPCAAGPAEEVVDTTGCGDTFSAAFLWAYTKSRNPLKANAIANIVAGAKCEAAGLSRLDKAKKAVERLPQIFPELYKKIDAEWPGEVV